MNSPSRTPRSSKTNFIPSPVKFDKEDAAEEEEEDHQQSLVQNVSGILEDMDEDDREIAFRTPTKNPPRSQYSAYVADEEELSEVAMKAAMEIADLDGGVGMDDLQPLVYDDTSNDGSSPLKLVLRSSPRKAPSSPIKESTTASPRKSPKKVMSPTKVTTPLKGASLQITAATKITTPKKTPSKANSLKKTPSKANSPEKTPSKKQTPVKRTPLKNVADRTPMKNETPLASPAKTATPEPSSAVPKLTRRSSSRLGSEASSRSSTPAKGTFPIFGKTTAKTGLEEGKANNNPTATTRSSKRSLGKSSADQMILDAGQKKIGCYPCEVCGFLYTRGDSEAEKVHEKFHKQYLGVVAFSGWKSERVIKEDHETRFVDSSFHSPCLGM